MLQGTVSRVPLEAGFFGIITDDGVQLEPTDLPEEFRQDGLRISFDWEDRPGFSIRMWGRAGTATNVSLLP